MPEVLVSVLYFPRWEVLPGVRGISSSSYLGWKSRPILFFGRGKRSKSTESVKKSPAFVSLVSWFDFNLILIILKMFSVFLDLMFHFYFHISFNFNWRFRRTGYLLGFIMHQEILCCELLKYLVVCLLIYMYYLLRNI